MCSSVEELSKEEFCARFVAHMIKMAPFERFTEETGEPGETVADYAAATAELYYEETTLCVEGPEECAEADMSCWGL